jgi:hypothetical protein
LAALQRRDKAATNTLKGTAATATVGKLPELGRTVSQTDRSSQQSSIFKQEQQQAAGSAGSSSTSSRQQSADGAGRPALEISGQGCEVRTQCQQLPTHFLTFFFTRCSKWSINCSTHVCICSTPPPMLSLSDPLVSTPTQQHGWAA